MLITVDEGGGLGANPGAPFILSLHLPKTYILSTGLCLLWQRLPWGGRGSTILLVSVPAPQYIFVVLHCPDPRQGKTKSLGSEGGGGRTMEWGQFWHFLLVRTCLLHLSYTTAPLKYIHASPGGFVEPALKSVLLELLVAALLKAKVVGRVRTCMLQSDL